MENPLPETSSERQTVIPTSRLERFLFALIIAFLPWLAFWGIGLMRPEWQSGQFVDYMTLLVSPGASFLFFPLLAYAILAYWLLLLDETRSAAKFWVRFGIYTGLVLAGQYIILIALVVPFSILVGLGTAVLYWVTKKLAKKAGIPYAIGFLVILALLGLGFRSGFQFDSPSNLLMPGELILFALMGLGFGSPVICFLIALPVALGLWREYDLSFKWKDHRFLGLVAWLSGFTGAWVVSVYRMIELYNALPTRPPDDCYIATAAARGHPGIVGSHPIDTETGTRMVNRQLQTLKLAELVLMALAPGLHRPLRGIYNALGRPLARRLSHPILADLAYLLLKPVEFGAWSIMRILLSDLDKHISRLYR